MPLFWKTLEVVPLKPVIKGILLPWTPLLRGRKTPLGLANGSWLLILGLLTMPVTGLAEGLDPPSMSCMKKVKLRSVFGTGLGAEVPSGTIESTKEVEWQRLTRKY